MRYFIVSYFNPAPIDGHRLQNRTVWLETMLKIKKIKKIPTNKNVTSLPWYQYLKRKEVELLERETIPRRQL